MESDRIEILLEKYFQGETSIAEEQQLQSYFSSPDVAQHLEQYAPIFCYFSEAKMQKSARQVPLQPRRRNIVAWLSVAASAIVLLGIGITWFTQDKPQDLGTYDNPEVALRETKKALALLSGNVNKGIESVQYVQEYEDSKNLIFKK
jgi:hypothetical protein